jgi:sugar phosphate isomerase/epimerase
MMKRTLIVGLAVVAAGLVTAGRAPAADSAPDDAGAKKLGWKLACQAYTFREMSAFEAIDVVHRLGLHHIELYPGQRLSPETGDARLDHTMPADLLLKLKMKLQASDVKAMNYGVVGLNTNEAEARKVFDFAKALKLETIVSEPAEEAVPMIDRLCQEYGINMAIHDHPKPSHYWNPESVLRVSEGRSKRIGSCADTGHWYRSGLVPVECLKQLEGRIISFHLKDLNLQKEDVPFGMGACDVKGMLTEVKRQGIRGVFSIEYESTTGAELIANVEKCRDYFFQTANELAGVK